MEILTMLLRNDGSSNLFEFVTKAIEGTGCFIVERIEHNYIIGGKETGDFFKFGAKYREMQLNAIQ